jgi:hypothetical protein
MPPRAVQHVERRVQQVPAASNPTMDLPIDAYSNALAN